VVGWSGGRIRRQLGVFVAGALIGTFLAPLAAAAAPVVAPLLVVTTTADPAPGPCAETCTLRSAVAAANAVSGGGATIVVPAGSYTLERGPLRLAAPVTLQGAGAPPGDSATTLLGSGARVLEVATTGATIDGVVITGGSAGRGDGGGVLVERGAVLDLVDSTLDGNTASEGAGLHNTGTARVTRSTISANVATKKGGGVLNAGAVTLTNSTVSGNTAAGGGGVASSSAVTLLHSTVVRNQSTNKVGGGVYSTGGSFEVQGSIIALNDANSGDARDCSGSPNIGTVSFVGNPTGCTSTGIDPLIGDPQLGPLADNGGSSRTHQPLEGSRVVDPALGDTTCQVADDQRGVPRPSGPSCDIGSVELAPFGIGLTLSADLEQVGAGAATVPLGEIPKVAASASGEEGEPVAAALAKIALAKIALAKIALAKIALAKIGTESTPLGTALAKIELEELTIGELALAKIALAKIALAKILLSELDLQREGGWEALLGTDVPIQSLTLADVIDRPELEGVTLAQLGLGETALAKISVAAVSLGTTALAKIALDDSLLDANGAGDTDRITEWCTQLAPVCDDLDIDPTVASSYEGVTMVTLALADAALAKIALAKIPLSELALDETALAKIALAEIALAKIDWTSTALAKIALAKIDLAARPSIVDCGLVDCSDETLTLGEIALVPGALVGEVGDLLLLGSPALDGYSLADLLLGLLDPSEVPWEDLDLQGTLLQPVASPSEPTVRYSARITVSGAPADVDLTVDLPPGFALQAGSATLDGGAIADPDETLTASEPVVTTEAAFDLTGLAPGVHTVTFRAWAGLETGPATASALAVGTAGGDTSTAGPAAATVDVVQAAAGSDALGEGILRLGHISTADEIDTYQFTVTPELAASGASARILLSNLPADYDLVLFGPPEPSLRGVPTDGITVVEDQSLNLRAQDEVLVPDPLQDIPLAPPDGTAVSRIGARRDTADELIETGTLRAGTWYVQVSGYNGATSPSPYALRLRVSASGIADECLPQTFPSPEGAAGVLPASYPAGLNTVFLVNQRRLTAVYGQVAADDILAALGGLADRGDLGVVGAVVPVDGGPGVDAAYDAWDANRCSVDAANAVVSRVGDVLDGIRADHPDLANVVLIGDDLLLPFGRVPDGTAIANERTHAPGFAGNNQLVASLAGGQLLTDDPYATARGLRVNDHELYVTELAVGRLLGTADQIVRAVDQFTGSDGRLDPTSALVTGYDFLTDGANAVSDGLAAGGLTPTELIDETWTRQQLIDALAALGAPAAAAINGHFDESRALPAAGNATGDESDLFLPSDVPAGIVGSLLFSMGCHGGLNTSDLQLGEASPDWAERFADLGDLWVANTGFGYGDTELVALSERLMTRFAQRLNGDLTVGAALTAAKQAYLAETAVLTPYDEKVVQEVALYGLPMYRIGLGAPQTASTALDPASDVVTALGAGPITASTLTEPSIESTQAVTVDPDFQRHDGDDGSWFSVGGRTLNVQNRPVQPLTTVDVTRPDQIARGALITGLASRDEAPFDPLYFRPTVDLGAHEPRNPTADPTFPATMSRIATSNGAAGPDQSLVLVPGQFRGDEDGGVGTQRLFTHIEAVVHYGPGGAVPQIFQSTGQIDADTARFEVRTDGAATRVYVLFKPIGTPTGTTVTWTGVDLILDGDRWVGGAPALDGPVEFMVQAVGPGGVAMSNAKAMNFRTSVVSGSGAVRVTPVTGIGASGWYSQPVTIEIQGGDGLEYSIDRGPFIPYEGPFVVSGEGVHLIQARDDSGAMDAEIVGIDAVAPTVDAAVVPDAGSGWAGTDVTVSLSAQDPGGSGVASLHWTVAGGPENTVSDWATDILVDSDGVTDIVFWATDEAGNTSAPQTVTARIDRTAPQVSCPSSDGLWHATNVTITCTASDAGGSGVAGSTSIPLTTNVAAGVETASASTGTATVCDLAGNCVTAGPVAGIKVDRRAPDITITQPTAGGYALGEQVPADFACADGGSGVATCVGTVADGSAIDTSGAVGSTKTFTVTASDVAGNTWTRSVTYSVGYAICLLYDPASASPLGGTVPIKLRLCDGAGNNLSAPSITLTGISLDGSGNPPPPNFSGNSNNGFQFRYDAKLKGYIYNFSSAGLAVGDHTLDFTVGSSSIVYHAPFVLR